MLNKPHFKPCYFVETIEPDKVFFLSEREVVWLSGFLYHRLAALIDGQHGTEEIIETIQSELLQQPAQENTVFFQDALNVSIKAQYALFQMQQLGYIVEDDPLPSHLAIFCHHLNVTSTVAQRLLQSTKVTVKALGSVSTEEFITILESLDIQVSDVGDLTVILTDDYLHQDLEQFNQQALQSQHPWMLVNPQGTMIWIGPMFSSDKTGGWNCLAHRLHSNRPVQEFIRRHKDISTPLTPPLGFLASTLQTALGMAATEVFKWIVQGQNKRLEGTLVTYDTLTLQTRNHIFVKRPQCSVCGDIGDRLTKKPVAVVLGHSKKPIITNEGHRCSPQEILRKYQHHISPITGIVRELSKVPGDDLTHTYIAKHDFLTIFDDLDDLRRNLGGRSAGKGRTDIQARVSGLCEAIERYSGVFQGDEMRKKGSYQQMGGKAIHPNDCMNFSQTQYANRQEWNASCSGWFQKVPEPFDEEREIEWTPVWSLTHEEFKYLPTAYCYYGYPQVFKPDCWADSNGCAAGYEIEEAILQGFIELVERDSIALWWYNRLKRPRVDLESFDEPYFQALKDYYQTLHRELWLLDLSSDLSIPVFAAIIRRTDQEVEDIVLGYGAHFDPKIAIQRALTEANQILPSVLKAHADGSTHYPPSADPLAIEWWKTATLANQPYLVPEQSVTPKVFTDYSGIAGDNLVEDLKFCQQIVEKNGLEMLVLDQTRPDIGLKVAKVIVPGMRHMWRRLGRGRLYEVPVKMGWLKEPLKEDQINPFPMWM